MRDMPNHKALTCVVCGGHIRTKWGSRTGFCSREHHYIHKTVERIQNGKISYRNKRPFKKYLILKRGHRCQKCNLSKWLGYPIPLDMHHKDGDVSNMDLDNVELTCPNCHSFTDTYKSKNRGNGVKNRDRGTGMRTEMDGR
jgi:5-methylcytosine-specific restriction endonuclease McrA